MWVKEHSTRNQEAWLLAWLCPWLPLPRSVPYFPRAGGSGWVGSIFLGILPVHLPMVLFSVAFVAALGLRLLSRWKVREVEITPTSGLFLMSSQLFLWVWCSRGPIWCERLVLICSLATS